MVLDTGRIIQEIDKKSFISFEDLKSPYPYPIQQYAKFALIYWTKENQKNPYIWFLNLPLDEESRLNTGARNHFVSIIKEALGASFSSGDSQQEIPDNPYIKTPDEKKIAVINAKLKHKFKQPVSNDYLKCSSYFVQPDATSWQAISVQGMADFITDLSNPVNQRNFDQVFFDLPAPLHKELASLLEHNVISKALANRLCKSLRQQHFSDIHIVAMWLRLLSSHSNTQMVRELVIDLLPTPAGQSADVLVVLTARCWPAFEQDATLVAYLEHIAQLESLTLFSSIFADLVALPSLRNNIFKLLSSSDVLPHTRKALDLMIKKQQGK